MRRGRGAASTDDRAFLESPREYIITFFAFPPDVRRIVYTANAIEGQHMRLRKFIKTGRHFPGDEAATKPLWLALRNILADKVRSAQE